MSIVCHSFHVEKDGSGASEYEDAFACDIVAGRFAVADGATQGVFSGRWAKLLAEAFAKGTFASGLDADSLRAVRQEWKDGLPPSGMPWYLENKLLDGSFATLMGLEFVRRTKRVNLLAIGDSCCARIRLKRRSNPRSFKARDSFPIENPADFDRPPNLLRTLDLPVPEESVRRASWDWEPGDIFFLMTDAFAAWFLRNRGLRPWAGLLDLPMDEEKAEAAFRSLIRKERSSGRMRNDDVTLMVVRDGR